MSISAVNGVSPTYPPTAQPQAVTPAPIVTPFSQQLDAQSAQTGAGHHHHHGGASKSVTSSPATAASAAGVAPSSSVASALLKLLS